MPPIHRRAGSSWAPGPRMTVPTRARGLRLRATTSGSRGRADGTFHAAAGGPRGRAEFRAHAAAAGSAIGHPHGSCLVRGEPDDPLAERGVAVGGPDVGEEQQPGGLGGHRDGHRYLVVVQRGQRVGRVVAVHDRQQAASGRLPQQLAEIGHRAGGRQVAAGYQDLADLDSYAAASCRYSAISAGWPTAAGRRCPRPAACRASYGAVSRQRLDERSWPRRLAERPVRRPRTRPPRRGRAPSQQAGQRAAPIPG